MNLKCDFELMNLGEEYVAVPVGEGAQEYNGVIKMNESAAVLFRMIKNGMTTEEMVTVLKDEYDISNEKMSEYINQLVDKLKEMDFVE